MKITNVRALLFLGTFVGSAAASTLGQCRAFCKSLRPGVLDDVSACLAAVNLAPVPKLYHACVDGRKKAFDRACVPLCARAALTVTSFEGCQAVKKGGRKNVDWCRKVRGRVCGGHVLGVSSLIRVLPSFRDTTAFYKIPRLSWLSTPRRRESSHNLCKSTMHNSKQSQRKTTWRKMTWRRMNW
jgi:hypothetical protein